METVARSRWVKISRPPPIGRTSHGWSRPVTWRLTTRLGTAALAAADGGEAVAPAAAGTAVGAEVAVVAAVVVSVRPRAAATPRVSRRISGTVTRSARQQPAVALGGEDRLRAVRRAVPSDRRREVVADRAVGEEQASRSRPTLE